MTKFRFRVLRGGCWLLHPPQARAAFRDFFHVEDRYDWLHGMRVALTHDTLNRGVIGKLRY